MIRNQRLRWDSLLAAALLLAAGSSWASPPTSCTTDEMGYGKWTVTVTEGPCTVDCDADESTSPFCNSEGSCTGIEYSVTQNDTYVANRVVTMVRGTEILFSLGPEFNIGEGDSVTGLGKRSLHEQAVRLDASNESSKQDLRLVVDGIVPVHTTTVVVKSSTRTEACKIAGLGGDDGEAPEISDSCVPSCGNFDEHQVLKKTEILQFKDCAVEFVYNLSTGEVVSATLTPESVDNGCDFEEHTVDSIELKLNGNSLGTGQFGDGYFSSGSDSCTTRIVGGKSYTFGKPCP